MELGVLTLGSRCDHSEYTFVCSYLSCLFRCCDPRLSNLPYGNLDGTLISAIVVAGKFDVVRREKFLDRRKAPSVYFMDYPVRSDHDIDVLEKESEYCAHLYHHSSNLVQISCNNLRV